jgi:hypothetical protein
MPDASMRTLDASMRTLDASMRTLDASMRTLDASMRTLLAEASAFGMPVIPVPKTTIIITGFLPVPNS